VEPADGNVEPADRNVQHTQTQKDEPATLPLWLCPPSPWNHPCGTCRGGRFPIIWGGRIERRKKKIREIDGALASSGWGDTTTNRESAQPAEYSLVKRIAGR
jgi:hypothetical protein